MNAIFPWYLTLIQTEEDMAQCFYFIWIHYNEIKL